MSQRGTYLPVVVPEGREEKCRIVAVPKPEHGLTEYHCQQNPQTPDMLFSVIPVQNVTYHLPHRPAEGMPLESLYAILKDQLLHEMGTVSDEKNQTLRRAVQHLEASLIYLVDANRVPAYAGGHDAEDIQTD